jgi:hypothetical protein
MTTAHRIRSTYVGDSAVTQQDLDDLLGVRAGDCTVRQSWVEDGWIMLEIVFANKHKALRYKENFCSKCDKLIGFQVSVCCGKRICANCKDNHTELCELYIHPSGEECS